MNFLKFQEFMCLYSDNTLFQAFLVIVFFDILLGTMKAFSTDTVNSRINKTGLTKHVAIVLFIMFMMWLFKPLGIAEFSNVFIMFYIASYTLSIIENIIMLGIPVPSWLTKHFKDMETQTKEVNNETKRNEK